jgi:hypothetical protein
MKESRNRTSDPVKLPMILTLANCKNGMRKTRISTGSSLPGRLLFGFLSMGSVWGVSEFILARIELIGT